LGGNLHDIKKTTEALIFTSKEVRLQINADPIKYIAMSRDKNAGRSHSINVDSSSFERVEELKYLGTVLTKQNSIQGEIKRRFASGNASLHLVQKLLFSSLLSKNIKIKI